MKPICYVYWIHLKTHDDIYTQGYVGVALDPLKRFKKHKWYAKNNTHVNYNLQENILKDDIIFSVVYEGLELDCYELEKKYRPKYKIGWNIVPGGEGGSTTLGFRHDSEFSANRSNFMKNKIPVKDAVTGESIGLVFKDHPKVVSGEWVHTTKNKKFSVEHKIKLSESNAGKNLNKLWWNNGLEQKRSSASPGNDWVKGRLNYSRKKNVVI